MSTNTSVQPSGSRSSIDRVGIRIGSTVVNCADIETMTDFWSQVLGLVPSSRDPGDDFRVLRGDRVNLSLQLAKTPVMARDQMHLGLYSDDTSEQVERLLGLGATSGWGRTTTPTTPTFSCVIPRVVGDDDEDVGMLTRDC